MRDNRGYSLPGVPVPGGAYADPPQDEIRAYNRGSDLPADILPGNAGNGGVQLRQRNTQRLRRDQAPADIPLDSRSAQCCAEPFLRHLLRNGGFRSRGGERYLAVPFGGADSGTPRAPQGLLRAQTLPEVHQP